LYRWKEHTSEVQLELSASTAEGIFEEALAAVKELLADGSTDESRELPRGIEIMAPDAAALLVRWIDELTFIAEVEGLVPAVVLRIELADGALRATVGFHAGAPRHLVKGTTYHGLSFGRHDHGWRATVVLDV